MSSHFEIAFYHLARKPTMPANPAYPAGIDLDVSKSATITCTVELPYPAPQVGLYRLACTLCGYRAVVSVAARADDPKSVKLPCKKMSMA